MKHTTLIYIEKDKKYLMLHRVKKENDENKDKWIGIGGKLEFGESPFDCARREMTEETGLVAGRLSYRGLVTFVLGNLATEYMHIFHTKDYTGKLNEDCNEGVLAWVPIEEITSLPIWEGDKLFLDLIKNQAPFFSMKLCYDENGKLLSHETDYAEQ